MTAPALLLLGHGSHDRRTADISRRIATGLRQIRPNLEVHSAFLDVCGPTVAEVGKRLAAAGTDEVVVVPLLLSDAFGAHEEVPAAVAQLASAHPDLCVAASRPIGPEAQLLSVIDRRLRDALRARHVSEMDGLVFAAAGSPDVRSNAIVARRARQWATHHKLPCVTSFATGSGPSTAEAVRTLRSQGRRHIAVGSWFLAPSLLWVRQAEMALEAGAVAVSEPMGGEPEVAEVALTRYVVAAMDLVDLDSPALVEPVEVEVEDFTPVRHLSVVGA
jgi:sirohydrochlorin ferrochelatase